jgi:hypothetical protein
MSDVIEEDIEAIEDVVEEKVEVKKKKPYLLSPLRLEALTKAREKAFSLRKEFHDNKEPTIKKERIKKKSKLEVELENRELMLNIANVKKKVDEKVEVVEKVENVVDEKVVNEKVVEKVVDEKVVDEKAVEKAVEKVDEKVVEKVVVKTRPSFVRNENGFFCI